LNNQLGGSGTTAQNLTPITFSANSTHHSRVEEPIKNRVNARPTGQWVSYEVVVNYPNQRRPTPEGVEEDEGWLALSFTCRWQKLKPEGAALVPDGPPEPAQTIDNFPNGYPQT
jgi:hypothetical protein